MARVRAVATIVEQALGAATVETVLQIVSAANDSVALLAWGVFFDGIDPVAAPVQVTLSFQSTAGTSAANTPARLDQATVPTLQTTARDGFSGAEPTTGASIRTIEVHPQGGFSERFPLLQEPICVNTGRIGIVCTAPAAVNCRAFLEFEE